MKKILTYIGEDSHSRPVYRDAEGKLYKDADPRVRVPAILYTVVGNDIEGELNTMFLVPAKFVPKRITW